MSGDYTPQVELLLTEHDNPVRTFVIPEPMTFEYAKAVLQQAARNWPNEINPTDHKEEQQ